MTNEKDVVRVLVWVTVAVAAAGLLMGFAMWAWGGSGGMMGTWGGMMAVGGLWMILPVLLVVLLVYALVTPHQAGTGPQDAITILEARYARGEIARDEYLRVREDLEKRTR